MPLSRVARISLLIGGAGAALTVLAFGLAAANPSREPFPLLTPVLSFGAYVAVIAFGGRHELAVSDWWIVTGGALVNGLLWFIVALTTAWVGRAVLRARRSARNEHVT